MIKEVLDVLLDLTRSEMTLLVVTYEMAFAREMANRLVFMNAGEIVEVVTPDTFFDNPETDRTQLFQNSFLDVSLSRLHRPEPGAAPLQSGTSRPGREGPQRILQSRGQLG